MPPRSRAASTTKAKQAAAIVGAVVAAASEEGTDSVPIAVVKFEPETQIVLDETERFETPQHCYGDPHGAAKAIADLRWFIKANMGDAT